MNLFVKCAQVFCVAAISVSAFGYSDVVTTRDVLASRCDSHLETLRIYDRMTSEWEAFAQERKGKWELDILYKAVEFAADKHEGQVRKDPERSPYIVHPLRVCSRLWHDGAVRNVNTLCTAILHDTIEDTDATAEEIRALFGDRITYATLEVSDDQSLSSDEKKQRQLEHAPHMSLDARLVKLADRMDNVWSIEVSTPIGWDDAKIESYWGWGVKLRNVLHGTNTALETQFDSWFEEHYSNAQ